MGMHQCCCYICSETFCAMVLLLLLLIGQSGRVVVYQITFGLSEQYLMLQEKRGVDIRFTSQLMWRSDAAEEEENIAKRMAQSTSQWCGNVLPGSLETFSINLPLIYYHVARSKARLELKTSCFGTSRCHIVLPLSQFIHIIDQIYIECDQEQKYFGTSRIYRYTPSTQNNSARTRWE